MKILHLSPMRDSSLKTHVVLLGLEAGHVVEGTVSHQAVPWVEWRNFTGREKSLHVVGHVPVDMDISDHGLKSRLQQSDQLRRKQLFF